MAGTSTIASLATAGGTLVLAIATFSATRSANRAARVSERALNAELRPVLRDRTALRRSRRRPADGDALPRSSGLEDPEERDLWMCNTVLHWNVDRAGPRDAPTRATFGVT